MLVERIPDELMTASSYWDNHTKPHRARLDTRNVPGGQHGAWSAKKKNKWQWIQADFSTTKQIVGVVTKGRHGVSASGTRQWVETFKINYSNDGQTWESVKDAGANDLVFYGNTDQDTPVKNILPEPITARILRIKPITWNRAISMRFDVIGCDVDPEPIQTTTATLEPPATEPDTSGYGTEKFLAVLPAGQELELAWNHPCVEPYSVPIDIKSNPAGVKIIRPGWMRISNTDEKHMGLSIESYHSTSISTHDPYLTEMKTFSFLVPMHQQGSEYFAVFPKELTIERFLICVTTISNKTVVQFEIQRSDNSTYDDAFVADIFHLVAFVVSKNFDTSGSRIVADGNVAVSCMFRIETGIGIIQSLPVKVLGKRYILVPYQWKTEQKVRIVTVTHSTSIIKLNTTLPTDCLPRGHVLHINVVKGNDWKDITSFHADRPLLVLETLVSITRTFLLSPTEQYNTYITDNAIVNNLHFSSCIFIYFSQAEPKFNLTYVDMWSLSEIIEKFTSSTTYSVTDEYTSTLAYSNKTLNGYGTSKITSSVEFSGSCNVSNSYGSYLFQPHHSTRIIYQDCQLLQKEVCCDNCNATYQEDCKEKENKQQTCAGVLRFVPLHLELTGIAVLEMEPPVAAVVVKSIVAVSVGIVVAGFLMVSAVRAMKYVKRKTVRRSVGPV
ncbi:hypothetical protein ScPMuIL_005430 [Solemya velum]